MAVLNQCNFIGRTGQEPTLHYTASGQSVASVSIACSEKFKNKAGEQVEKTEWVNLVFWGKLAEIVGEFVGKGQEIFVSGKFTTRTWDDKDGNKRTSSEIVCDKMQLLGGKGGKGGEHRQGSGSGSGDNAGGYSEPGFDPDEVPF